MDESAIFLGIHPLGWNGGKDPGTIDGNSFLCVLSPAINGYVMDTLPGLVMAQHQRIRWYLLSMGSNENIHSIHQASFRKVIPQTVWGIIFVQSGAIDIFFEIAFKITNTN